MARPSCTRAAFEAAEKRLFRAMKSADKRGYTGYVGSRGGLFDDPRVKAAKRRYDYLIVRCGRR